MKTYLKIAKAHIEAVKNDSFDLETVENKEALKQALMEGKTIKNLLESIEIKYTSITAIILSRSLYHESKNYISGVNKGFKIACINLGIQ